MTYWPLTFSFAALLQCDRVCFYVCCSDCAGVCGKVCCVAAVVKNSVFFKALEC